jgi:hypothetical protein
VVLCIDVHGWASPAPGDGLSGTVTHDALDCLLAMLSSSGLGRTQRPVPVVLTGSKTADGGPILAEWSKRSEPGFREFTLGELAADDAMLGYQWVLLHPWTTKPPDDDRFGRVYTPDPLHRAERLRMGQPDSWEETLRWMGSQPGSPTSVQDRLYDIVQASYLHNVCRRDDDEQAWRTYIQAHPGYQL